MKLAVAKLYTLNGCRFKPPKDLVLPSCRWEYGHFWQRSYTIAQSRFYSSSDNRVIRALCLKNGINLNLLRDNEDSTLASMAVPIACRGIDRCFSPADLGRHPYESLQFFDGRAR